MVRLFGNHGTTSTTTAAETAVTTWRLGDCQSPPTLADVVSGPDHSRLFNAVSAAPGPERGYLAIGHGGPF